MNAIGDPQHLLRYCNFGGCSFFIHNYIYNIFVFNLQKKNKSFDLWVRC